MWVIMYLKSMYTDFLHVYIFLILNYSYTCILQNPQSKLRMVITKKVDTSRVHIKFRLIFIYEKWWRLAIDGMWYWSKCPQKIRLHKASVHFLFLIKDQIVNIFSLKSHVIFVKLPYSIVVSWKQPSTIIKWAWICSNTSLFMNSEVWISYPILLVFLLEFFFTI